MNHDPLSREALSIRLRRAHLEARIEKYAIRALIFAGVALVIAFLVHTL
jgi:hypothetical protein